MEYLKWTANEIEGLARDTGIVVLLTEVDMDGTVTREIGLDQRGDVVHAFPCEADPRGIFDLSLIDMSDPRSDLTAEEFEFYWERRSA